jgi:hypothetical protein
MKGRQAFEDCLQKTGRYAGKANAETGGDGDSGDYNADAMIRWYDGAIDVERSCTNP